MKLYGMAGWAGVLAISLLVDAADRRCLAQAPSARPAWETEVSVLPAIPHITDAPVVAMADDRALFRAAVHAAVHEMVSRSCASWLH